MIWGNTAHFTPGVRAEKLGANFKHFLAFCPTLRVANWLPKFYGTRFFTLGANTRTYISKPPTHVKKVLWSAPYES